MSTTTKLRKSRAAKAPLTPEEQMTADAQEYLHINDRISELEAQKAAVKERLENWYRETGQVDLGGLLTVQERNNPVKISGATGKRLEMLLEKLMKELPAGYVKEQKKLDLSRMYASVDVDPVVRALLNEAGLSLVQETCVVLKAV